MSGSGGYSTPEQERQPVSTNTASLRSAVWDYFRLQEYDDGSCTSSCLLPKRVEGVHVSDSDAESTYTSCSKADKPFTHKNTSTLKDHLGKEHVVEWHIVNEKDVVAKAERQAKKRKMGRNIPKVVPVVPYSMDDPRYRMITHHLAFFIG